VITAGVGNFVATIRPGALERFELTVVLPSPPSRRLPLNSLRKLASAFPRWLGEVKEH
jgi:hypothetical protein